MQSRMTIGDLSHRNVVCIGEDSSLKEAAGLMRSKHVGSLVVVHHAERGPVVTGILTDRDIAIVAVARDFDPQTLRAADVMTPDGMLVGIVSFDDLLQAIAEDIQTLVQAIAGERRQETTIRV